MVKPLGDKGKPRSATYPSFLEWCTEQEQRQFYEHLQLVIYTAVFLGVPYQEAEDELCKMVNFHDHSQHPNQEC